LDVLHSIPAGIEGSSVQPAAAVRHQFAGVHDLLVDAVFIGWRQRTESVEFHVSPFPFGLHPFR
jgi:hypothetical protein